jgi:hypothetical protein
MNGEVPDVPPLSSDLRAQLDAVRASRNGSFYQHPCSVTLRSGQILDRVYVEDVRKYIDSWGWDAAREYISVGDVVAISASPVALPVEFAEKIYKAGESGMGYFIFTLVMKNGTRLPFMTGGAVDFPNWPPGAVPGDVVDALPHEGRSVFAGRGHGATESGAAYSWCLYAD